MQPCTPSNTPTRAGGENWYALQLRVSIVVSISACHADDPGSIPGRGTFDFFHLAALKLKKLKDLSRAERLLVVTKPDSIVRPAYRHKPA